MSRNVRQKFPRPPAKVAKRRGSDSSSSLNLSSDGGYSGVEEISDSDEEDEENVYAAEEEHMIHTRGSRPRNPSGPPRPPVIDDDNDDADDDDDDDDDEDDEEEDDSDNEEAVAEEGSWDGIMSEDESESSASAASVPQVTTPVRHVRFVDVPSSDSDSTETEDDHADFFPDLFVDQSSLDPAFRREIEGDEDESSNSSAFWDFHGPLYEPDLVGESDTDQVGRQTSEDDTPMATPKASQELSTAVSTPVPVFESPELDGYESDGDTTEDDVPELVVRRKVRTGASSEPSDSESNRLVRFRPGKPRVGSFDLNSSQRKPVAVVNPISRKMMIFTPYRRHQLDLSPEQFNFPFWNKIEQSSPILSNSGGLMMGAMMSAHTFGDFMNSQPVGPAEAFFPFMAEAVQGETSDSAPDDEDDAERNLDISDFITWQEGDSSDEGDEDNAPEDWTEGASSPCQRRSSTSDTELLSHLNSDTVSAFRRNQINQQLIYSNKATQDSLAFSAPYNLTALRGLKSERLQTAAAPLTPARRHKKPMHDASRSPLESVSQKRKASGDLAMSHKRQRSITDVNLLRI